MPDVLAVTSESHPIEVDTLEDALGDAYAVRELELPAGSVRVRTGEVAAAALSGADAWRRSPSTDRGYDHVDLGAATEQGVVVTHNPEGPGPAVVEHTLSMAVVMLRRRRDRVRPLRRRRVHRRRLAPDRAGGDDGRRRRVRRP